jgi:hypothetical protein
LKSPSLTGLPGPEYQCLYRREESDDRTRDDR